jgi:hypothetical protein
MSIRSLTTLAVERERASPDQGARVAGGQGRAGVGATADVIPVDIKDALTSAIPTEPLAAYTAAIGILAGIPASGADAGKYLPFRWAAFVVFLVITAAAVLSGYRSKRDSAWPVGVVADPTEPRRWPSLEMMTAMTAAATWGLAMPGSALNTQLSKNAAIISAGSIAIGGSVILYFLSSSLTKPSSTSTKTVKRPARMTPPNTG